MTDHMEAAIDAAVRTVFEGMKKTRLEVSPEFEMSVRGQSRRELEAAEPHLRKKWAEELVERIGASNLGAPIRIYPDGTARIASGPEMRTLLCEFILAGADHA